MTVKNFKRLHRPDVNVTQNPHCYTPKTCKDTIECETLKIYCNVVPLTIQINGWKNTLINYYFILSGLEYYFNYKKVSIKQNVEGEGLFTVSMENLGEDG